MPDKTMRSVFHEMGSDEEPLVVEGSTETWLHLVEVVTADWTPHMVDLWGMCSTCEDTVRVESHSHNHVCLLKEPEGCSWIDPDDIGDEIGNDLIPPETIGDWDLSLYLVGPTGSNHGRRTRRVNGVIVDRDGTEYAFSHIRSDKTKLLPEIGPSNVPVEVEPYGCSYCKRRFNSRLYYAFFHTCSGWEEAQAMLALSKREPQPEQPVRTVVRREAASRDNWYEADRNRVPSELGKLDWLNPRQD